MSVGSVGYTTTKNINPMAYNGIRSTGFKGVKVFQSDTTINRTVVINEGDTTHKSGGSKAGKIIAGILGGLGLLGLGVGIASLFKKDKTDDTQPTQDTTQQPPADQGAPQKTLFGGMLEEVIANGDASLAKAKGNEIKDDPFYYDEKGNKLSVEDTADKLKSVYGNIVKDIKIEQQSDGTYKATILIPDTLKYNGMTSSTELTGIKSPEDLDNLVTEAMQNLYTGGSENPFAAKAAEGEE